MMRREPRGISKPRENTMHFSIPTKMCIIRKIYFLLNDLPRQRNLNSTMGEMLQHSKFYDPTYFFCKQQSKNR